MLQETFDTVLPPVGLLRTPTPTCSIRALQDYCISIMQVSPEVEEVTALVWYDCITLQDWWLQQCSCIVPCVIFNTRIQLTSGRHKRSQNNPSLLSKFINRKRGNPIRTFSLDSLFCSFLLLWQVLDNLFFLGQETLFSAFAGLLRLGAASFSLVTGWENGGVD